MSLKIKIRNLLRCASYNDFIVRVTRTLHLHRILKKWYYRYAKPRFEILQVEVSGITAQFYIHTPDELRMTEGGILYDERRMLETLISTLKSGDIVYDIGAAVGLYTVFLARAVKEQGQVIAFEPSVERYNQLLSNLKLNSLSNVFVFRKALGNRSGEAKLYYSGDFNLLKPDRKNIFQTVELVHGDQFVKAYNLPIPNAVKIDVEGYELFVLKGLADTLAHPNCELICCEVHPNLLPQKVMYNEVLDLIKSFGFSQIDIWKRGPEYHIIAYKA